MKQFITTMLLFACVTGYGQVVITESDLPQVDSSYVLVQFDADSNLFGTGEGLIWDLGNVTSVDTLGFDVQPISNAPLAAQLVFNNSFSPEYAANHFYTYRSSSLELAKSQAGLNFDDAQGFYKVGAGNYALVGIQLNVQGFSIPVTFDDVDEIHGIPLQAGQELASTSSYSLEFAGLFDLHVSQGGSSIIDGSGKVILPDGSQRDILRLKSSQSVQDSLCLHESAETIVDEYERVTYSWIGDGGLPWVQITLKDSVVVDAWWQKSIFGGGSSGCTNSAACNYNETATDDDASCHYDCHFCLDGTIWSEALGGCIVANPSDSNFDGCVQLNDLLDLLSAYGDCGAEESTWQCGDPLEYQGYAYETVLIGEQCWFAENLRSMPNSGGCIDPQSYCTHGWAYGECFPIQTGSDNVESNAFNFGLLYKGWCAVSSELCPVGWRIPSLSDFELLISGQGGEEVAGESLKETGTLSDGGFWEESIFSDYEGANNASGFSARPAGGAYGSGTYFGLYHSTGFWSSSLNSLDLNEGWYLDLNSNSDDASLSTAGSLNDKKSIRCIKD
tara:strand:+ start:175 stop:1854 length:1680 start_codon:yes stop_codon:yes gene_type:complete